MTWEEEEIVRRYVQRMGIVSEADTFEAWYRQRFEDDVGEVEYKRVLAEANAYDSGLRDGRSEVRNAWRRRGIPQVLVDYIAGDLCLSDAIGVELVISKLQEVKG